MRCGARARLRRGPAPGMTRRSWRGRRGGGFALRAGDAEGDPWRGGDADARPAVGAGEGDAASAPAGSWASRAARGPEGEAPAGAPPSSPGLAESAACEEGSLSGRAFALSAARGGLSDGSDDGSGSRGGAGSKCSNTDSSSDTDSASGGGSVSGRYDTEGSGCSSGDLSDLGSADEDYLLHTGLGAEPLDLEVAQRFAGLDIDDSLTVRAGGQKPSGPAEAPGLRGDEPAVDTPPDCEVGTFVDVAESLWHRRQGYRHRKKERRREGARQTGAGGRGAGSGHSAGQAGRLRPGEKARAKKEGREARRAARAARRGFDLKAASGSLAALAARAGDSREGRADADYPHVAFANLGKMERQLVRKMAGLYGLRTECLGGGKRASLVVTVGQGPRRRLQGQDAEDLQAMLSEWAFRSAGEVPPTRRARVVGPRAADQLERREGEPTRRAPDFVSGGSLVPSSGEAGEGAPAGGGGEEEAALEEHPSLGNPGVYSATPQVMGLQQFASFEAHTTGFGSRMLAKMGFKGEGSGLGRSGQGIASPVLAERRPKKKGLGSAGTGPAHGEGREGEQGGRAGARR